ncbi:MAG TPA: helix-turn-helix transcriptional regulator [Ktedonobacteraceae bacterium]|nr:helix-turn-helix transcriptional regulator [Ktedonobacteraceae bacterium]
MGILSRDEKEYSPGLYGLPHMGEVIAYHRVKMGWTSQETFAIVCGVDKQNVAYWENQRYLTDMDRRIFLCKLLKISPALLGLTWHSVIGENEAETFNHAFNNFKDLLEENAFALYEDILIFSNTSSDKYSPAATYRFYKHQQELEQIVKQAPEIEKNAWQELLSRFYQHSTFIAQHRKNDETALALADKAVALAMPLQATELIGAALYRRSRVHLIQNRPGQAKEDIQGALDKVKRMQAPLKGSTYLLSAEVNSLYAGENEKLRTQCRVWQDNAIKLLYNGKVEDDGTFLTFNLYAVHHERAKTLLRFALFYANDHELVEKLTNPYVKANDALLKEAMNAILNARKHLGSSGFTREMYLSITEAKIYLVRKEYEESAKIAKVALQFAYQAHSKQGTEEIKQLYRMLRQLAPRNPYVANLGVELKIFPSAITE